MLIFDRWILWRASPAGRDVVRERIRQVSDEGWSAAHDDEHRDCSLAMVAALYAAPLDTLRIVRQNPDSLSIADPWPANWGAEWDKRKTTLRRGRLVKAGALILAEIERIDRAEALAAKQSGWTTWRAFLDYLRYTRLHGHPPPTPPANLFKRK